MQIKSIFYLRHKKIELINHQRLISHIFIVTSPSKPSPLSTLIEHITDITITTASLAIFFLLKDSLAYHLRTFSSLKFLFYLIEKTFRNCCEGLFADFFYGSVAINSSPSDFYVREDNLEDYKFYKKLERFACL